MLSSEFTIRPAVDSDMPMVYSYWVDAHRDQVLDIPRNWYRPLYNRLVRRIVTEFPTNIDVVCLTRIPDQILGFIAYEDETKPYLHYLFVKKIYRRHGIAQSMLDNSFGKSQFRYTMKPGPAGRELLAKFNCRPSYRYIQREPK